MFRFLVNTFTSWQIFILFTIVLSAFSLIIFCLSKYCLPDFESKDADSMNTILGFLGGAYGIILGFVIVNLWGNLEQARHTISEEARGFDQLVINTYALPPAPKKAIFSSIENYVCSLTTDERRTMAQGHTSSKTVSAILNIFNVIQAYKPQNAQETIYYNQIISNLSDALKARRERVDYIPSRVPAELYFILILGAFIVIGVLAVLQSAYRVTWVRMTLLILASVGLACNLSLAFSLNYPFSGDITVNYMPFVSEGALVPFAKCKI